MSRGSRSGAGRTTRTAKGTKSAEPARSSLFVGSTEKAFQVLHAFDGPQRYMTLADIARAAGLDRSATQRLVYTLETLGYLKRIEGTRNYGLTSKVLQFSHSYLKANDLIDRASPYLLDISRNLGETCNLHELDGHEIVFVARFPGQHLINIDIVIGSRLPTFFTASGTAILSALPEDERLDLLRRTALEPLTPYTVTDPDKLLERVRVAAQRGYAVIMNETVMGDISVAAPVIDEHGRAIAAINISVPTTRWTVERAEAELVQHVHVAATSISKSKFNRYAA
ncbi:helix-turn-helix domain-containing protein [Bradyrhizobium jicamae]|uniref:Helix-turn-helix domain-containing protein n=1 Tax=Bradyrhizobium jicamae TaxID=280332 RepID=A0ABS5FFG0_9BRAD|nr:IclR family transcriptional regulator C-terminal domain-containing protein [Bradyrhizobium jicamae]MBR0795532.1 helix-turn-helix domain-containing protein [Bradyrhizobium jicamae]MBR0932571.1 helix-turn-helix domain-containing protein [Bradyrhizobium jicamae]